MTQILNASRTQVFLCVAKAGQEDRAIQAVNAGLADFGVQSDRRDLNQIGNPGMLVNMVGRESRDLRHVFHLAGGDQWLTTKYAPVFPDDAPDRPYIRGLNLGRESLFESRSHLVFWLNNASLTLLGTEAPDFFSWRAGVFQIDPDTPMKPSASLIAYLQAKNKPSP